MNHDVVVISKRHEICNQIVAPVGKKSLLFEVRICYET